MLVCSAKAGDLLGGTECGLSESRFIAREEPR